MGPDWKRTAMHWATSRIAPPVCVLCGGTGQVGDETWGLDLCDHCERACRLASGSAADGLDGTAPEAGCDALRVLFRYRPPVDRLVTQLKFALDPAPARVLAMLFARALRPLPDGAPRCIVPMPLHPLRLRERGFNQCELIARQLGRRLSLPVQARLLVRQRHTEAQSTLPAAARSANVAGAFALASGIPTRNVPDSVALLDDVMTTGSTLAAAAGALRAAGVRRIEGWICARVPEPGQGR